MQIIHVQASVAKILRNALLGELGGAASKLDDASLIYEREKHPELFFPALKELDTYRATIEEIGWGEPARQRTTIIDLDARRGPIVTALNTQLQVERDYMREDLKLQGARRQRKIARHNARVIERFLREHGLPICPPQASAAGGV